MVLFNKQIKWIHTINICHQIMLPKFVLLIIRASISAVLTKLKPDYRVIRRFRLTATH